MYESYFGLRKSPFLMTPDPEALLMTQAYREALAGLYHGALNRKGFVVLTGEAGTGKTTLVRKLLQLAANTGAKCSVVFNPLLTSAEFLELLLINFGERELPASKALRLGKLEKLLLQTHGEGKAAVLIVDEAHKLSYDLFEEIRLLTNFETAEQKLLQIVLCGQPELDEVLKNSNLWQLKQRVAIRVHLDRLGPGEVKEFIQHRWTIAGGALPHPFTEEAAYMIALWSQGIPRLVNSICENALLQAMSQDSKSVEAEEIAQVILDLDLPDPVRRVHVSDAERTSSTLAWSRTASPELAALAGGAALDTRGHEPEQRTAQRFHADLEDKVSEPVSAAAITETFPEEAARTSTAETNPAARFQTIIEPLRFSRLSANHTQEPSQVKKIFRTEGTAPAEPWIHRIFARLGLSREGA